MREHRLIERMVDNLKRERESTRNGRLDPVFVDDAVDFFRTYADRTHHGKEEDILFRDLSSKSLQQEHKHIMDELVAEHVVARRTVKGLLEAKNLYIGGDKERLREVERLLGELIELYPAHIEKEDKRFFYPAMDYFTATERDAMLVEFHEFDRNMIHEKYGGLVDPVNTHGVSGALMRCSVCGYVYDPGRGDPEHGVDRGVPFEKLPDGWVCPICFASKSMFAPMA